MSEVTLTIRDGDRSIHNHVHGSEAMRIAAALSADPETIDELGQALQRFQTDPRGGTPFHGWEPGDCDQPWDAGVHIIDLAARMVFSRSSYAVPGHAGSELFHDGRRETDLSVRYHIADHWLFRTGLDGWEAISRHRRDELKRERRIDIRTVLYDKFYGFAVEQCLRYRDRSEENPIVDIHRQWLMTPRDDLAGRTPREVLLADREHLDIDIEHRASQWSRTGQCPPSLPDTSTAYRLGGVGTHEWVFHYEFARFVLEQCWSSVQQRPDLRAAEEAKRLEREANTWLYTPQVENDNLSPFQIVDRERHRIPLAVAGDEATVDDDCPLCQMMCDSSGPVFVHFDGSAMDEDFAFSRYLTRDDWDQDQAQFDQIDREMDKIEKRHQAADVTEKAQSSSQTTQSSLRKGPWQCSGGMDLASIEPLSLEIALFRIGAHLAELDMDLKRSGDSASLIETLNRGFGNLRAATTEPALLEPVVERFCDNLEAVGRERPHLADKCTDLQDMLRIICERIAS